MITKKNPSADVHQKRPLLFSISLVVTLSMTIVAFEWKSTPGNRSVTKNLSHFPVEELLEIPPTEQPPPPIKRVQLPVIIEVPDEEEISEEIVLNLDQEVYEEKPVEAITVSHDPEEVETGDEIFLVVESPPQFVGGQVALNKFLIENVKYPARASRMGIQGKVFVKAVIEKDGSVTSGEILKGISLDCDKEALRVVSTMPKWIPGKQRGRQVRCSVIIPLNFTLQ
jgi:protein TonB